MREEKYKQHEKIKGRISEKIGIPESETEKSILEFAVCYDRFKRLEWE